MKRILLLVNVLCFTVLFSSAQVNLTQIGKLSYNQNLSDVWGYATGANEYALVGANAKFSIVDITNPGTPVEIFSEPGPPSTWRDIKVWNDHAYVIHDSPSGGASGVGLLIVDLSPLPQSTTLTTTYYTGTTYPFSQCHNIFIDENGILYLFGADNGVGGCIMYDLTNPTAPVELGQWDEYYVHDGMVRGDTLWASCISNGFQ
ncbi:MAG: choice-of-anchor B family protein, partial [Bacteroidia bacterium]|nr:choice-of-anchor B family protein [Bacteroidia bacterium]